MSRKLRAHSRAVSRRVSPQVSNRSNQQRNAKPAGRRTARRRALPARRRRQHPTIELANRQRLYPIQANKLRAALRQVLRSEGIEQAHVELALVDDSEIRQIHREFLNLDTATDVLTFPLNDANESLAGVIVVSVQTAMREAPQHGQSVEAEILLYAIHGILHLCGYDDHKPSDARQMRRRQAELLRAFKGG